jgi:acyl-coenzyme A thioesterase PaaI-like protein
MSSLPALSDLAEEYEFLDSEDRYRLLIELGRKLEAMPEALKTDATKVRGCSSSTWVYPTRLPDGRLHFLADSNAAITKGVVALILSAVQDRIARGSGGDRYPGIAGTIQSDARTVVEPNAGRTEHDCAGARNRCEAGCRMSQVPEEDACDTRRRVRPEAIFRAGAKRRPWPSSGAGNIAISADKWIELALPWREELVGIPEGGFLASGAIVSLLDTCGGASVWMALGQFQPLVTIELRLDYLRPSAREDGGSRGANATTDAASRIHPWRGARRRSRTGPSHRRPGLSC